VYEDREKLISEKKQKKEEEKQLGIQEKFMMRDELSRLDTIYQAKKEKEAAERKNNQLDILNQAEINQNKRNNDKAEKLEMQRKMKEDYESHDREIQDRKKTI